ncbi:MAG: ParB N-terminal domain-containing protein [Gammaproteobacteria bacterium]|nr:ParB N-terminal domain-containing protein [Gammaproteobacteria bacterium]
MARKTSKAKTTKSATTSKAASRPKASATTAAKDDVVKPIVGEIQMIPLNKLELSPKNVRKAKPSETDDAELLASIRENGIKQNLAGYEIGNGEYLIDAGGRRLKALKQLAEEGAIAQDQPVACLIEDEAEATITSTTENLQRVAMHPADQFIAFDQMISEGRSEDEIAVKFGVSVDLVRRRLKLARVAPEILEQFRENEITLECVMAFTLTDHHDRQITVWNTVKEGYQIHPHHIKRLLTETGYSANSKLGCYVGVQAYKDAGGAVMTDLFSEHDNMHLENPEILERLAIEKLQLAAADYVGDWKWVDVHLELDHSAFRSFGHIDPQEVEPDPDLVKQIETLNAREEELAQLNDEGDWSDEEHEEYYEITPRISKIEDQIEAARPYAEEDRLIAGVVITLGQRGDLQIEKGLVRPEDIPAPDPTADASDNGDGTTSRVTAPTSSTPVPVSDPASALRKADGITLGLADDLRTARHHILRAHLSADYDLAFDVMLYTLCENAFGRRHSTEALDLTIRPYYAPNCEKLVVDSVSEKMLEALKNDLNLAWMELEKPDDLRALSALPTDDKQALFAWATGLALRAQMATDNHPSEIIEELGARMDVDVAACWRPTAANYWGTVTKAHIAAVAKKIIGDEFANERSSEKKGEAAAAMEQVFSETAPEDAGLEQTVTAKTTRWLPKGMEFAEANFVDEAVELEPTEAAENDAVADGETLPAFLKDDAA